jgi:hypothetical protein
MGCLGSTDWRTLARRIRKQEEKAMVSGVYRLPTMENVIFRKRFVELLAQEVDRVEGLRSLCRDAITNIGAIDCFVALPITAS